jgi:acyl-CoA reductase-like NAD-dependent aldehyde dehydrogenase
LLEVGDPLVPTTQVGPIISRDELSRIHAWVSEAVDQGAELLSGGRALSESLYAPTVLIEPPERALVSQREVFGPVVCLYGYDEFEEAIRRANALPFAFQAAIFSNNPRNVERFIAQVNATAVIVNDHTAFRVDWMPFGGLRASGQGLGGIPDTMRDYTTEKLVVERY